MVLTVTGEQLIVNRRGREKWQGKAEDRIGS